MPCLKMVASLSLPTSPHPHTSPLIVPRREPEPESGHTGHCSSSLTELLSKVCKNSQNLAFTRARVWLGQTINCQGWDWGYFPPTEFKNIFNLMTRCFRYEWRYVYLRGYGNFFLFWFPLILNPGLSLPCARKHHT